MSDGKYGSYANKGDQWMSFEDVASITEKMGYVESEGLGGVSIWSLSLDDFNDVCGCGRFPLLSTINKNLGRIQIKERSKLDDCVFS